MDNLQAAERVAGTALKRFGLVGKTALVTGGTKVCNISCAIVKVAPFAPLCVVPVLTGTLVVTRALAKLQWRSWRLLGQRQAVLELCFAHVACWV